METKGWIEGTFPNPEGVKKWLKEKDPDLYAKVFPAQAELSPHMAEVREKFRGPVVGRALSAYLDNILKSAGSTGARAEAAICAATCTRTKTS